MDNHSTLILSFISGQLIQLIKDFLQFIWSLFVVELDFLPNLNYYSYVHIFFEQNTTLLSASRLKTDNFNSLKQGYHSTQTENIKEEDNNLAITMSDGYHYYWYRNRIIIVNKKYTFTTGMFEININVPFGTKKFLLSIRDEIKNEFEKKQQKLEEKEMKCLKEMD